LHHLQPRGERVHRQLLHRRRGARICGQDRPERVRRRSEREALARLLRVSDRGGMQRLLVLAVLAGCSGGLRLTRIDASVQHPSNVAVYFTVDTTDGDPVAGLTAESFKIYEDNQPVSILESKQTILNPEVSASHYTLLLIDMSGSVAESGDVPVIV